MGTNQTQISNNILTANNVPTSITSSWSPIDNSWEISHQNNSTRPKKDAKKNKEKDESVHETTLAEDLFELDQLWLVLSECLEQFDKSGDSNAFLIVQSAVEAFFMVHSLDKKEVEYKKKKLEEELKKENNEKIEIEGSTGESSSGVKEKSTDSDSKTSDSGNRPDSGNTL